MQAFTQLSGIAAPLLIEDIDTDQILPKQFLTTVDRLGLGKGLFYDLRFHSDGSEKPDFILNQPYYRHAKILLAGANFGCGSSREHAPWALLDFGFRSIVAPSYADIFYANCLNNGILPVVLSQEVIRQLADRALTDVVTVDLMRQTVCASAAAEIPFDIDPADRHRLLMGVDPIDATLAHEDAIAAYEAHTVAGCWTAARIQCS